MSKLVDQYMKKLAKDDEEIANVINHLPDTVLDDDIPDTLKSKSSFKAVNKRMKEIEGNIGNQRTV
jgi:hypothetical protein